MYKHSPSYKNSLHIQQNKSPTQTFQISPSIIQTVHATHSPGRAVFQLECYPALPGGNPEASVLEAPFPGKSLSTLALLVVPLGLALEVSVGQLIHCSPAFRLLLVFSLPSGITRFLPAHSMVPCCSPRDQSAVAYWSVVLLVG